MMRNEDFACLILTHGRPRRQVTLRRLERQGYTGKTYLLIDDEDDTADEYYSLYGDKVLQFSKREAAAITDRGDNFKSTDAVVWARNMSFVIAKRLGLKNFLMLDDDYGHFCFRAPSEDGMRLLTFMVTDLDKLFDVYLDYLNSAPIDCLAMHQNGDFISGVYSYETFPVGSRRKR